MFCAILATWSIVMLRPTFAVLICGFASLASGTKAFAWGETGHNVIGRVAARAVAEDPSVKADTVFVAAVTSRYLQMGHLANVPDIHWRSYDVDGEDASLLGDGAHFFDSDMFLDANGDYKVSLDYEEAKKQFLALNPAGKFYQNGTMPWRTQQLYNLYVWNLRNYPVGQCAALNALPNHPTRTTFAFAGIMTHFTGDASQPYHTAVDYDGVAAHAKGIHSYFESTLVDALEFGLDKQVYDRAKVLLTAPASVMHSVAWFEERAKKLFGDAKPGSEVVALLMAEANDSLYHKPSVEAWDMKFSVATAEEAWAIPACATLTLAVDLKTKYDAAKTPEEKTVLARTKLISSPKADGTVERACRRDVGTKVDRHGELSPKGRPVKTYFEKLIVERLAVASAITAHLWIKGWQDGGKPALCSTYQYGLKPSFVSPTDPNCFGYAMQEASADFLKKDETSALPWKHGAVSMDQCLTF